MNVNGRNWRWRKFVSCEMTFPHFSVPQIIPHSASFFPHPTFREIPVVDIPQSILALGYPSSRHCLSSLYNCLPVCPVVSTNQRVHDECITLHVPKKLETLRINSYCFKLQTLKNKTPLTQHNIRNTQNQNTRVNQSDNISGRFWPITGNHSAKVKKIISKHRVVYVFNSFSLFSGLWL